MLLKFKAVVKPTGRAVVRPGVTDRLGAHRHRPWKYELGGGGGGGGGSPLTFAK